MKKIFLLLFCSFLCLKASSQNCFGEYNSTVSSLACINYQFGFDVSLQAAIYSDTPQHRFAYDNNMGSRTLMKSFCMMDRQGKFFNIHQYGFAGTDMVIEVVYKIISVNRLADVAIVINGQPVYHKEVDISEDKGDNLRVITDVGVYANNNERFSIILQNSDLVGFQIHSLNITRID